MIEINIKIEFYGRARMILGLNSFEIKVNEKITKKELISLIGKKYPKLIGEIIEENKSNLKKSYNIGINGIKNPSENELNLKSNDSILIEDQPDGDNFNYRLLNLDMSRFDIATVANNTFMEIEYSASETDTSSWFERDSSSILISRTEQIV